MGNDSPRIRLYGVVPGQCNCLTGDEPAGGAVYALSYKEISCLVSDAADDWMVDRKSVLKDLLDYQSVMERFLQEYTVIPIKFGTCVESREDVLRVLESGYAEFLKSLGAYDGLMEVDITVAWNDIAGVARKIAEEDQEIKRLRDAAVELPADEVLAQKIKIGSLIKCALDRKRVEILQSTLDSLTGFFVRAQKQEITDGSDVFNCAFLIEKKGEASFFSQLEQLNRDLGDQLRFKCVSPLPPYAFCTFEVRKIGRDVVERAKILLGVDYGARLSRMKEIYLKKVLECHPDKDIEDPGLEDRFKELTEAYKVLCMVCNGQGSSLEAVKSKDFLYVNQVRYS